MPIFLLLAETTWTWQFAAKQLESWVHMVTVEEVLIDRARSAFLVHWFGMHLPLKGLGLKVYIENLQELSDRYLVASKSAKGEVTGLNLTEPLAGIAGQVAGTIVSPIGILLRIETGLRKSATWVQVLAGVLLTLTGALFAWSGEISGVVLGVGLPVGFLAGLALGGTQEENTGAAIEILGALAKLLNAARQFLELILGPVEKIKNPLLAQIMKLFQGIAALVPQVLGFVAILVTRIGPMLLPLIHEFQAFLALLDPVRQILKFIKDDFSERLKALAPVDVILRITDVVIDSVESSLDFFLNTFLDFLVNAKTLFVKLYHDLKGESGDDAKKTKGWGLLGFFDTVGEWLHDAVHKHPLVVSFEAWKLIGEATAGVSFGTVRITAHFAWHAFSKVLREPGSGPSTFPEFPKLHVSTPEEALASYKKPAPAEFDFDAILSQAKDLKLKKWPHGPDPLSVEAERQLDRFRHPRSAFGLERKALIDSLGRTPEAMLKEQQKLRDLISVVVGRILPPELRGYMDDLVSGLKKLDETVLGKKEKTKNLEDLNYPVRHIPDNGELRPIVRRLIVRSTGGDKLQIQDFEDRVRKAMLAQRYLAPEPA
jgi:hypothetical protein